MSVIVETEAGDHFEYVNAAGYEVNDGGYLSILSKGQQVATYVRDAWRSVRVAAVTPE